MNYRIETTVKIELTSQELDAICGFVEKARAAYLSDPVDGGHCTPEDASRGRECLSLSQQLRIIQRDMAAQIPSSED